ncbi:alpha/beta fold hydrolase [Streptomyces thermocarboxydus]
MRTAAIAAQAPPRVEGSRPVPSEPEQAEERKLAFEGFRYTCRIVHQGSPQTEPLLLLGGSSQNRYSWQSHEKWLAPLCTLITVDLPGYGSSDFLPASYDISFLGDAVQHMLTEVGVPEVNLFGGCFGEVVGLRFAQRHPESVKRMVFAAAANRLPALYSEAVPRLTETLERGDIAGAAEGLVRLFMSNPEAGKVRHAAVARLLQRQFLNQTQDEIRKAVEHNIRLVTHGCYEPLPVPRVPTLVFTGSTTPCARRTWGVIWLPPCRGAVHHREGGGPPRHGGASGGVGGPDRPLLHGPVRRRAGLLHRCRGALPCPPPRPSVTPVSSPQAPGHQEGPEPYEGFRPFLVPGDERQTCWPSTVRLVLQETSASLPEQLCRTSLTMWTFPYVLLVSSRSLVSTHRMSP